MAIVKTPVLKNKSGLTAVDMNGNVDNSVGKTPTVSTNSNTSTTTNKSQGGMSDLLSGVLNNNSSNSSPAPTQNNTVSNTANDSVWNTYNQVANNYSAEKEALANSDSTLVDAQTDALNSKLTASNELVKSYLANADSYQSSKVQSELAQQNASKYTQQYMNAVGLGTQGVAESSQVQAGNNYVNTVAGLNASKNSDNSNAYDNYLQAINNTDLAEQEAINNTMATNEELLGAQLSNAISSNNTSMIDKYIASAEQMYSNGEISKSYYDSLVDIAEQYQAPIDEALDILGVENKTPVYSSNVDTNHVYSWLNQQYGNLGADISSATEQLVNGEDGASVVLSTKLGDITLVKSNDKIYIKGNDISQADLADYQKETANLGEGEISAKYATESDFGEYLDSGKEGSKQYDYVNRVIELAKSGQIKEGTTINFNYGYGSASYYTYTNGKWVKGAANRDASIPAITNRNLEDYLNGNLTSNKNSWLNKINENNDKYLK